MPELPEVQTIVNDLQKSNIIGLAITTGRVFWHKTIAPASVDYFYKTIAHKRIHAIRRRAKYIIFQLSESYFLLIHLRMTGRIELVNPETKRSKHHHLVLELNDGRELRFFDPRKFGKCWIMRETDSVLGLLGPEPLEKTFTAKLLFQRMGEHKRMLKPLMLDQTFIAGLGNIYVDEALWEARLHPQRRSNSLSWQETRTLHRTIRKVLRQGLKNRGSTLGGGQTTFYSIYQQQGRNRAHLRIFRRTGEPCPRCRTIIQRIIIGQRSTHICPSCQQLIETDDPNCQ